MYLCGKIEYVYAKTKEFLNASADATWQELWRHVKNKKEAPTDWMSQEQTNT